MTLIEFSRWARLLLAGCLASISVQASAQVLEVGPDGDVKTYSGPAAVYADGSIVPLRPKITAPGRQPASGHIGADFRSRAAIVADLSSDLIEAVAWNESRLHPGLVSPKGAIGEMQLMPATARALGADPYDSEQNYRAGAAYLRSLMERYHGDLLWALAAYNAGPKAVEKYHGVPPFKETQNYVAAVLDRLSEHVTDSASDTAGR